MEKVNIVILAEKIITKKVGRVSKKGRCGRVYVPRSWINQDVIIIKRESSKVR